MIASSTPVSFTVSAAGAAPGFYFEAQLTSNLCWAASIRMVANRMGLPARHLQCEMPTYYFGADNCCPQPDEFSDCNKPLDVTAFAGVASDWGINATLHDARPGTVPIQSVIDQLTAGRPVPVFFAWTDGGRQGHFAVVGAVNTAGPEPLFLMLDPGQPGPGTVTARGLATAYGSGECIIAWQLG
jgi:hypothetical protein